MSLNRRRCLWLLLAAGSATACRSVEAQVSITSPAELTATAVTRAPRATATPSIQATPAPSPTVTVQPTPSPTPGSALGKIAYVQGGDIWVRELPDGAPRRLTRDGTNERPRWSPSGEWLAFQKKADAGDLRQLWVIRSTGADAHTVDVVRPALGLQAQWSPVADRLAYISPGGLFVEDAGGGGRQQLVPRPGGGSRPGELNALAWSPDGAWIAYERLEWGATPPGGSNPPAPASQGLWRVKANGTENHDVYLNPKPGETQSYLAGWSPDGQRVLFWGGKGMSASLLMDGGPLMAVGVNGGAPTELVSAMLLHRDFLSWSPDGQQLALVAGAGRSTWYRKAIAVASLGGAPRTLSDSGRSDLFPAWSPDGHWIAFTDAPETKTDGGDDARQASGRRRIWAVKPDGTEKHALTSTEGFQDERPEWSRDSGAILFARLQGDAAQVWLMRADGSNPRRVVDALSPGPSDLGIYGYLDWARLYDWWRG